jgi:sugar/nucleoside kinase (ribokinase family)
MKELDVVVVGDIAWNHDITPTKDEVSIGGAAYYSAVGASCFSDKVGIVARVGGDFELNYLKNKGINIEGVRVIPNEKTCRFEVTQYSNGTRYFEAYRGVAGIVDTSIFPDRYNTSQYIHLSTQQPDHALIWLNFVSKYQNVSVDSFELFVKQFPELTRQMFKKSNLIFTNEEEWQVIKGFGDDYSDKPMIIKRGKEGAVYKYKNKTLYIPAPEVTAVDFSGPGDILAGAFLSLLAQKMPVEIALKKAVDLASYSVTEFGVEHIFNNVK